MKKAQRTDFFREILRSRSRFLSLLFIVALGTAFYAGIRSSGPDMNLSADRYYDETRLMDIWIMSTLGLTGDDLDEISEIEGIEEAEGGYTAELYADCNEAKPTMRVVSLSEKMNYMTVIQGTLPKAPDECFMDQGFMNSQGYQIGDRVRLIDEDGESPGNLKVNEFKITGYGTWSWYLSWARGTASIGDGSLDAFMAVSKDAFDMDFYTVIYARVDGARELGTYDDDYEELVDQVRDRIELIALPRSRIRYAEVYKEANDALADAEFEVSDGERKLADAYVKLTDGEQDYADGLKEYEDGLADYQDGKAAYREGENELVQARKQLDQGWAAYDRGLADYNKGLIELDENRTKLEDAQKQLDHGTRELDKAEAKLKTAKEELESARAEIAAGYTAIADGQKQLEAARAEIETKKKELDQGQAALEEASRELDRQEAELEAAEAELKVKEAEAAAAEEALAAEEAKLDAAEAELDKNQKDLETQLKALDEKEAYLEQMGLLDEKTKAELDAARMQIQAGLAQIDSARAAIREGRASIAQARQELEAGKVQIQAGWEQVNAGRRQLQEGRAQIEASLKEIQQGRETIAEAESQISQQSATLSKQKAALDQALIQLDKGEAEILSGEKEIAANRAELEAQSNLVKAGWEEFRKGHQKLIEAEKTLADSKKELEAGEKSYQEGIARLKDAWIELQDAQGTLADGRIELNDARKELDDGWKEYYKEREKALPDLADAKREIAKAKADLEELKAGEWYVLGRDAIQNSVEYGSDAERIGNLGKVFPAIFFLVAALVCLTTMTRMIEEERMLIGTMKALGYSKLSISAKYLLYALLATLAGGILGAILGSKILPFVIMKAYGMLYSNVHYTLMPLQPDLCLIAIGLAMLATVGAALAACYKELLSVPAALMRPPVPKTGSRILLERIPAIWNRLNFSMKSTVRNLVRYKKRFIMTVVGIGGCMAVLLVSFGLHDSIMAIVDNQYKTIWTYSISCGTEDLKSPGEREAFLAGIQADQPDITEAMFARYMSVDVSSPDAEKTAYLYVVEDLEQRDGFLSLHDRETGQIYDLTEDGVVITEKLGRVLGIKPGDKLSIKIRDNEYKEVLVTAAAENYIYNYVYMAPDMYRNLFGEDLTTNEVFFHLKDGLTVEDKTAISEYLMTLDDVNSVTLVEKLQESVDNMLHALDLVVWVLVIAAGLLVFVVTFNLNNINISERRRELASLKVLGFFDQEVAMYVYRENVFLTIFGIIAGFFMGYFLHRYVILSLEVDLIMFGRDIRPVSYLEAAALTAVFSVLVNLLMNWKLKAIDMVESLKSVE